MYEYLMIINIDTLLLEISYLIRIKTVDIKQKWGGLGCLLRPFVFYLILSLFMSSLNKIVKVDETYFWCLPHLISGVPPTFDTLTPDSQDLCSTILQHWPYLELLFPQQNLCPVLCPRTLFSAMWIWSLMNQRVISPLVTNCILTGTFQSLS